MTLHLTSCHSAAAPSDPELRELASKLSVGRKIVSADGPFYIPFHVATGTRDAGIVVEVLRRVAGA